MPRRGIILVEREGFSFNPPAPAGQYIAPPPLARAFIQRTFFTKIPHLWCGVLLPGISLSHGMPRQEYDLVEWCRGCLGREQAKHPPAGAKSLLNDARSFRAVMPRQGHYPC